MIHRDIMSFTGDIMSLLCSRRDRLEQNPMKFRLNDLSTSRSMEPDRRQFIGGSDARIIMSPDAAALIRLWQKSRAKSSLRI
jgi:hypothetical protein